MPTCRRAPGTRRPCSSPPADGIHPVDSGDSEGLVLGAREAVAQGAQAQALVVPAAGPLHHVAHGHLVRGPEGGRWSQGAPVHLFGHCGSRSQVGLSTSARASAGYVTPDGWLRFPSMGSLTRAGGGGWAGGVPEISSSSSGKCCWLPRCSQGGGVYFLRVTYCRPMVLFAFFTRFLERVLKRKGSPGSPWPSPSPGVCCPTPLPLGQSFAYQAWPTKRSPGPAWAATSRGDK